MGTRGVAGFYLDGKTYAQYNQYDSYVEGLGQTVLDEARGLCYNEPRREVWREKIRALRLVEKGDKATEQDFHRFKRHSDSNVSTGTDYYALFRNLQGQIFEQVNTGVWVQSAQFLSDSLFCEYAYLINLDGNVLEVYRGFQTTPDGNGRYVGTKPDNWKPPYKDAEFYYGVSLFTTFPLNNLPDAIGPVWPEDEDES